jgi:hypothetical protein
MVCLLRLLLLLCVSVMALHVQMLLLLLSCLRQRMLLALHHLSLLPLLLLLHSQCFLLLAQLLQLPHLLLLLLAQLLQLPHLLLLLLQCLLQLLIACLHTAQHSTAQTKSARGEWATDSMHFACACAKQEKRVHKAWQPFVAQAFLIQSSYSPPTSASCSTGGPPGVQCGTCPVESATHWYWSQTKKSWSSRQR